MSVLISPNMNLPVPVVLGEPGPQYALDVNSALSLIDGHNHTSGNGVQVPSAGLNINSDLSFNNNRLLVAKSITFTSQPSPLTAVSPDLGAAYVSGVDLYYNDGNGNQIRITAAGNVAGAAGSISGLTAPASASYSSAQSKFIWQSDVSTSAGMDGGPVTIRQNIASAKGVTLQSAASLAADYTLTFPGGLPPTTRLVTIDSSGNIGVPFYIDNTTLVVNSNILSVGTITASNITANQSTASSLGAVTVNSGSGQFTNVVSLTCTGNNPVFVGIYHDTSVSGNAYIQASGVTAFDIVIKKNGGASEVARYTIGPISSSSPFSIDFPASIFTVDTSAAAGVNTYFAQIEPLINGNVTAAGLKIIAWEM